MLSITQWAGTSRRCFCLAIGAALVLSSAVSVEAADGEKRIMPPGLEGVEIGMKREGLLRVRPKAAPCQDWLVEGMEDLWGEAGVPWLLLQEELRGYPFAARVRYSIDREQGVLETVSIEGSVEWSRAAKQRLTFVEWCIGVWGRDCEERLAPGGAGCSLMFVGPLLMWRRGGTVIVARWTPELQFVYPDELSFIVIIGKWRDSMGEYRSFGRPTTDGERFLRSLLDASPFGAGAGE